MIWWWENSKGKTMWHKRLHHIQTAGAILFVLLSSASEVTALERWLVPDTSQCAANTTINPCHLTLQDAVTQASAGDSIRILPGTYPANVTLTKNITIFGEETARTFLNGNGGTTITVSGVTVLMNIKNLTFINASPGILVSNASSQINIENNVFEVGSSTTAIQVSDTSNPLIMNNTFYQNGTALLSAPNTLSIINNIFSGNTLAISANVTIDNILNNLFFANTSIGPTGIVFNSSDVNYKGNIQNSDPLFVDPAESDIAKRDFHLKSTTPCQDTGNASAGNDSIDGTTADIGAYGGSNSDTVPFPVSGLTITGTTSSTISLSWSANNCYLIGGYKVYYGSSSGDYTTTLDAGNNITFDITGLSAAASPTGAPVIINDEVSNQTITLFWDTSSVVGATGYEVRYDTAGIPTAASPSRDAGNTTSYALTGLQNGTYYYINVTAYAQAKFFIVVKAYYAANPSSFLSAPSNEVNTDIGTKNYSATSSAAIHDFPEAIASYPNLPNKGCFIATAAYGHYSAPQVQALREFRDRYLMPTAFGRAFVRWYYEYGPAGAKFINVHPWLKPVVRIALMPAVGCALFLTRATLLTKLIVLILAGLAAGSLIFIYRRKFVHSGGAR
jgi:hypothetical protein